MVDISRRASGLGRPSGRHSAGPNGPVVTGPATGLTHGSYARGDPQTPLHFEPNVFSIDNSSIGESGAQTHICAPPPSTHAHSFQHAGVFAATTHDAWAGRQ